MPASEPKYWFRAKRYGWGWGLPMAWQGWVVTVFWLSALALGTHYLVPRHMIAHLAFTLAMAVLLLLICHWKGEPPRWRWGERD